MTHRRDAVRRIAAAVAALVAAPKVLWAGKTAPSVSLSAYNGCRVIYNGKLCTIREWDGINGRVEHEIVLHKPRDYWP